jgi:uncharacterized membrane protein
MKTEYRRKSQIAAGIGLVLLIMLFETVQVHRVTPSPYSPAVWTVLGTGAVVLLAYAWWAKRKSDAAPDDD